MPRGYNSLDLKGPMAQAAAHALKDEGLLPKEAKNDLASLLFPCNDSHVNIHHSLQVFSSDLLSSRKKPVFC